VTTKQKEAAKKAFEILKAQHDSVYSRYMDEQISQRRKYGETGYLIYANKSEREKLDRLGRRLDSITDRFIRLLSVLSPSTDWTVGIGIATMFDRLTFEDACQGIKPSR